MMEHFFGPMLFIFTFISLFIAVVYILFFFFLVGYFQMSGLCEYVSKTRSFREVLHMQIFNFMLVLLVGEI